MGLTGAATISVTDCHCCIRSQKNEDRKINTISINSLNISHDTVLSVLGYATKADVHLQLRDNKETPVMSRCVLQVRKQLELPSAQVTETVPKHTDVELHCVP
jgi:hypothetical protein